MSPAQRATRIAALNDALRSACGAPWLPQPVPGRVMLTRGIMDLPQDHVLDILRAVRRFDGFSSDNDPYGERDFGSIDIDGVGKVFWKIDYYADETFTSGSQDPSDPARCFRLLTIMLAEEY